jgi:hypothetical protein
MTLVSVSGEKTEWKGLDEGKDESDENCQQNLRPEIENKLFSKICRIDLWLKRRTFQTRP